MKNLVVLTHIGLGDREKPGAPAFPFSVPSLSRRPGEAARQCAGEDFRAGDGRDQGEAELASSMPDKKGAGKMHILVLPSWYPTPDNPINGSFFAEQAEALARYGHRVSVFCWFRDLPRGCRVEKKERAGLTEYEFHYALLPLHLTYFRVVLEMVRVFRREFKECRPDVIHVHSFGAMRYAWALKRLFGVPVLVTEHATWFQRGLLSPKKLRSVRRDFAAADAVLAVSDGLAEAIQPYCRKPVAVVPNLVKETFFDRGPRPETDRPFRFITVGALMHKKGMDTLLAAFALAAGEEDMTLTVCGDGPEREALKRQAEELGIAGRVEFAGQVSREECARRLRESHAFVLASRVETFGVVFVEAMAAGLPVIMTKTDAWKALIREETGLAVEVDDTPALARAMTEMVRGYGCYDPQRIAAFCRESFSEQAVCRRLTEKYQSIQKRR